MKKLDFEVVDWSLIRYMVICNWGVEVGSKYPAPIVNTYYFENFFDMQDFVNEYCAVDVGSTTRKIHHIFEIKARFKAEPYEVVTKTRVVSI